jgi:Ca2+/Na+ antiporter
MQFGFGEGAIVEATTFTLGDGDIKVVISSGFHIKKIRTFTRPHSARENVFLVILIFVVVFIHRHTFRFWFLSKYAKKIELYLNFMTFS